MATERLVIVGAGLAGSAAAVLLARAGLAPLLLERTPHVQPRLCGEFISAEATQALATLGVDVLALGGRPTRRLRVACGALQMEAELPFTAVGLTRHALDGALQRQAVAAGARLLRGQRVAVAQVATPHQPWRLRRSGGDEFTTPMLMLACGKTDLAPLAREPRREPEPLVGLQTHLRLAPAQARAIEGHVEVMLFEGGYAGLQPVEGGRVNLCLLMQRSPARPGLQALLQSLQHECPLLGQRLEGAEWPAEPPQSIFRVPYGHLHRVGPTDPPGLWRLGDQAVVIPSYTGDGMALALHSAALAARVLQQGGGAVHYHRQLRSQVAAQVWRAHALYRLGRRPAARNALLAVLQRWPALLARIAALTRVQEQSLLL